MSESELFVVRIWRQFAGGFRASVRRVDDERTRHFTQPDEVARFLAATGEPAAGTNGATELTAPPKAEL